MKTKRTLLDMKEEIKEMLLFETAYEEYIDIVAEEKRNEGRKEGALNNLIELFNEGSISLTNASKKANLSQEEFKELASKQK